MYRLLTYANPFDDNEQRGVVWSMMNILAIFLFQAATILKRNVPECVLSVALFIFSINLGNIFVGKNASLRAFPLFETPIDTIEDIAERDMLWVQTHEAWVHSLLLTQNVSLQWFVMG